VAGHLQDLGADLARLNDVESVRADPVLSSSVRGGSMSHPLPRRLTVENVTFGHSPVDRPLIVEACLSAGPGELVAIVGASGSGKSTLARLICGLYEPWEGEVRFDGLLRTEIPRAVLANAIAFVDQEIVLFEGTVRDNITLWDPSIDDESVVAALRRAAVYDCVRRRPNGIDCVVEQDARNFSGGERQRLEIARALVRRPNILVLDEATSALDAETELIITDNVRRSGCACVVIAHRLSTIRDSDEILYLDHGRVTERGQHNDLVAAGGKYAALVRDH
jgi:ABC-type bacteriocin/lantibiotic exporter with double-glycine peptidase domain